MMFRRIQVLFVVALLTVSLMACGSNDDAAKTSSDTVVNNGGGQAQTPTENQSNIEGLEAGFPKFIPLFEGATVIESSRFNDNHFTVLYNVDADYETVVKFYKEIYGIDDDVIGEADTYVEGISTGDVLIKGLTIESTSDGTNVYMTLAYDGAISDEDASEEDDEYAENEDSSTPQISYDSVDAMSLPEEYQSEIVPVFEGAKLVDYSFAPNGSGYATFILPNGTENEATAFYETAFGVEAAESEPNSMQPYYANLDATVNGWRISMAVAIQPSYCKEPMVTFTIDQ